VLARDHRTALDFAKQATVVGPAFWIGYYQLAWASERLGECGVALEALKGELIERCDFTHRA